MASSIERYAVYWVDLDPVPGSEFAVDQIRTIDRTRLGDRIDAIGEAEAAKVRHVITEMFGVLSIHA
jgi:mRNA-degrading endonuclease toxin of MazEF toxin-antitoxin module